MHHGGKKRSIETDVLEVKKKKVIIFVSFFLYIVIVDFFVHHLGFRELER